MPRLNYEFAIGSFADKLTPEKLEEYKMLAESAPEEQASYMEALIEMLEVFWQTGESKLESTVNELGAKVTPLEDTEIERIKTKVPYKRQLDAIGAAFEDLPTGTTVVPDASKPKGYSVNVVDEDARALRGAAMHLLWYGRELAARREPVTKDKLSA